MKNASRVIIRKSTGEAILETFCSKVAEAVNTEAYHVVPILEYLQSLNRKLTFSKTP